PALGLRREARRGAHRHQAEDENRPHAPATLFEELDHDPFALPSAGPSAGLEIPQRSPGVSVTETLEKTFLSRSQRSSVTWPRGSSRRRAGRSIASARAGGLRRGVWALSAADLPLSA